MSLQPTLSANGQATFGNVPSLPAASNQTSDIQSLRDRLVVRLWSRLPVAQTDMNSLGSVVDVIKVYNDSFNVLSDFHAEADTFLTALCDRQVFSEDLDAQRPDRLRGFVNQEVSSLRAVAHLPALPVSHLLHAELLGEQLQDAIIDLLGSLKRSTEQLVDQFLSALDRLEAECVVGRIDWPVESACHFRYYATHVYERDVSTAVTMPEFKLERTTTVGTVDFYREARMQHLANARTVPLPEYCQFVPTSVRSLLADIPAWLQPDVEIVEGDLFRSGLGKRLLKTEEWEQVEERRLPFHQDPAVTVGPYVLAAWLCEERDQELHQAELVRRQLQERLVNQEVQHEDACWRLLGFTALIQIAALLLHVLGLVVAPVHVLAFIVSIAGLIPFLPQAAKEYALARGLKIDSGFLLLVGVNAVCGVLALQAAFFSLVYQSLPAFGGLLLLIAACAFFAREFFQAYHATTTH